MILSGIYGLTVVKLMLATTSGRDALIVTTRIIIKQRCWVKRWEDMRRTKIGLQKNDGVGHSKKR